MSVLRLILSYVCGTRRERLCVAVRGCRLDRQTAHRQPVAWFDSWSHLGLCTTSYLANDCFFLYPNACALNHSKLGPVMACQQSFVS